MKKQKRKENKHVRISKKLKKKLDKLKRRGETYEEIIWRLPEVPTSFWKSKR